MSPIDLSDSWRRSESPASEARVHSVEFDDANWALSPRLGPANPHETSIFRRSFDGTGRIAQRSWLQFERVTRPSSLWIDGQYETDLEPTFAPRSLEVTNRLQAQSQHVVIVEMQPEAQAANDQTPVGRAQHWGDVVVRETGPVCITRAKLLSSEASADRAVLSVRLELDALSSTRVRVITRVTPVNGVVHAGTQHEITHGVSRGKNRLRFTALIEQPALWWPWELGDQPLFDIAIEVFDLDGNGEASDTTSVRMGFRHVVHDSGRLIINGESLFLRGIAPMLDAIPSEPEEKLYERALLDVRNAGANLLFQEFEVASPHLYDAADRLGLLIYQTLPTAPEGDERTVSPALARQAVEMLGHHPSLAVWTRPASRSKSFVSRLATLKRKNISKMTERWDSSRPSVNAPEHWFFDNDGDQYVAGIVAKWSRRSKLVLFSAPDDPASYIDVLRQAKYQPIEGFIAAGATLELLRGACDPVRLLLELPRFVEADEHINVFVANDTHQTLNDVCVTGRVHWPGSNVPAWIWTGEIQPDSLALIGTIELDAPSEVDSCTIDLHLDNATLTSGRQFDIRFKQ